MCLKSPVLIHMSDLSGCLVSDQKDPRRKPGASILDVLGLVKKQSVVNTGKRDNSTDDGVDE